MYGSQTLKFSMISMIKFEIWPPKPLVSNPILLDDSVVQLNSLSFFICLKGLPVDLFTHWKMCYKFCVIILQSTQLE